MTTGVTLKTVCAPSEDVTVRDIEDEIIVPLTSGICDADGEGYTLNRTAQAIRQRLDGQWTLGDVLAALAAQYDAAPVELEIDLVGFTYEMFRREILSAKV